jgi:hypothetical protein
MRLTDEQRETLLPPLDVAAVWSSYADSHVGSAQSLLDAQAAPEMAREDVRAALVAAQRVVAALSEFEATWDAHFGAPEVAS